MPSIGKWLHADVCGESNPLLACLKPKRFSENQRLVSLGGQLASLQAILIGLALAIVAAASLIVVLAINLTISLQPKAIIKMAAYGNDPAARGVQQVKGGDRN